MALDQATKLLFARERPFVHHMPAEERASTAHPSDNNVSFYSGHTSFAFALATASGTVASLRGYRLAPLVWGTLLPFAALTGYLRIAGDKHYFTDVLTGMLVGSGVGVLLPLVFHGRRGDAFVSDGSSATSGTGAAQLPLRGAAQMVTIGGGF
jgi:membrane-associated phospholipid phosphatase